MAGELWDREAVMRLLNAHLTTILPMQDEYRVRQVPWRTLLHAGRFDVAAKVVYGRSRLRKTGQSWAEHLYRAHLRAWQGDDPKEGDGSGKRGLAAYQEAFDVVIDRIAAGGFDKTQSLIPIDSAGKLIDGAHRAAACIAAQIDPWIVRIDYRSPEYGADFFSARGLDADCLDAMAVEFLRQSRSGYMVCIFPIAAHRLTHLVGLIEEYGRVIYHKAVVFSGYGPQNLIAQLYRGEDWLGRREGGWPGARIHLSERFLEGVPVNFFALDCSQPERLRQLKERIRAACGNGNYSVHISDSPQDTLRLAEQLFNEGSIDLLNRGDLSFSRHSMKLHEEFRNALREQGLASEWLCIDGSSIMALYGLREGNDLDYLSCDEKARFDHPLISCHNEHVHYYGLAVDELVCNPRCHLYFDGIKYVRLQELERMKRRRAEGKDKKDVAMIEALHASYCEGVPQPIRFLPGAETFKKRMLNWARAHVPPTLRSMLNRALEHVGETGAVLRGLPDYFKTDAVIGYRGFSLHYPPGHSLIARIRNGGMYEPEVTRALIRLLQRAGESGVMLDIGANIGLIALNVQSLLPSTRVWAFEPGQTAAKCLRETVLANGLRELVNVSTHALSNVSGVRAFSSHGGRDCSGDGFYDTGRAGTSHEISVPVLTLDDWWEKEKCPRVDVIKIDTEGAELWVLQGGGKMLESMRPSMVLEINPLNLQAYPYDCLALEDFFADRRYRLYTLSGSPITEGQLASFIDYANDFMALPAEQAWMT